MLEVILCFCERQDILGTFTINIYVLQMFSSFTCYPFSITWLCCSQTNTETIHPKPSIRIYTESTSSYFTSQKKSNKSQNCMCEVLGLGCLSQMPKALNSTTKPFKLGLVRWGWIPSMWKAGSSEVQTTIQKVGTFLSYKRLYLKQKTNLGERLHLQLQSSNGSWWRGLSTDSSKHPATYVQLTWI